MVAIGDQRRLHDVDDILQLLAHHRIITIGDHYVFVHLPVLFSSGDVIRHKNQESEGTASQIPFIFPVHNFPNMQYRRVSNIQMHRCGWHLVSRC